jgi:hypothetical protein
MNKKIFYYVLPLTGHHFKGNVCTMNQLLAAFMSWAEKLNINGDEAISLWFNGYFDSDRSLPNGLGLKSAGITKLTAEEAAKRLPEKTDYVDLSEFIS